MTCVCLVWHFFKDDIFFILLNNPSKKPNMKINIPYLKSLKNSSIAYKNFKFLIKINIEKVKPFIDFILNMLLKNISGFVGFFKSVMLKILSSSFKTFGIAFSFSYFSIARLYAFSTIEFLFSSF